MLDSFDWSAQHRSVYYGDVFKKVNIKSAS